MPYALRITPARVKCGQPEAVAPYEAGGWKRIEPYGMYAGREHSIC